MGSGVHLIGSLQLALAHCGQLFSISSNRRRAAARPWTALWIPAVIVCGAWTGAAAQTKTATATSLAVTSGGSSVTTVTNGTIVTLTATVKAGSQAVSPGQVIFCDSNASPCTDIHIVGSAQLGSGGTALWRFRPGPGTHTYQALFTGTNARASSSSASATLKVTIASGQYPAAALISSTGSWGSYSLAATVEEFGGTAPLTGSISFLDTSNANAVLATAPLRTSTPGLFWGAQTPIGTPMSPTSMAVADFNGDGIPDVATVDSRGQTINVFVYQTSGIYQQTFVTSDAFSPAGIIVADFNSDGNLDIAVPNASANTVTILLGHGNGTFTASTVPAGQVNTALVAADFNGDGIPDLAVANEFSDGVAILLGNGDGTFTASPTLTGISSESIVAGDFNGDGKVDLAVTASGGIAIFTGNGDGTFNAGSTVTIPGNGFILRVIAADFNGDGKLDLAVSTGTNVVPTTGQVMVLLGNGDATFTVSTPSITPEAPAQLAIGDFNLDGIPDLAEVDLVGNISVLVGRGDGTFGAPLLVPVSESFSQSFAIGDMNGDGRPDLIGLGPGSSNTILLYFLLTKPTETASTAVTPISLSGVGQHLVVASYAGDANSTSGTSNPLSLWGTPPATNTTLAMTAGGSPATSVAANTVVTLTATVDVGAAPLTAGTVNFCDANATSCANIGLIGSAVLTVNGTATFKFVPGPGQHSYKAVLQQNANGLTSSSGTLNLTVGAPAQVQAATATTIAQTGGTISNYTLTATVAGVGSTSPLTGNVSFLDTNYANSVVATAALGASTPGLGFPISYSYPVSDVGYMLIAKGDFNGDGRQDIAAINTNVKAIDILLGNGDATLSSAPGITTSIYPYAIAVGDFNQDGKLDIAVATPQSALSSPGQLFIYLGNGDGTFTAAPAPQRFAAASNEIFVADVNEDGKLDIVIGGYYSTQILLGNGDGTFASPITVGSAGAIAVGDVNSDGIPDMILGYNGTASVYLGNADGTFTANNITFAGVSGAGPATIADFNGDGIPDVAIAGLYYSSVHIFLGKGDGTFTAVDPSANPSINEPSSIAVADLNGDGKPDLIVTNVNSYLGNAMNPDLTFMLGNGDGTFTAIAGDTQLYGTWSVLAADFNGDGRPDVIAGTGQGVSVLLTEPTQTATATAIGVNPPGPAPHNVDASYPGDSNYKTSTSATLSLDVHVATPVFTPASGTYTSSQTMTITNSTPGAKIYYATSQGYPTQWTLYTGPITLDTEGSFLFQAYATATGYEQSQQANATYTLNLPPAAAPVFTPGTGSYAGPQTVMISGASNGAHIYYTTDGTSPTTQSALYSEPLAVSTSEVISAMASGGGYNSSRVTTAQILINSSASSFIYTVAGNESYGYSGDGGPATLAALNSPVVALPDSAGNLYIADAANCVVRKTAAKSGNISTFAGNGTCGYSGDNGPAAQAQLSQTRGLAMDRFGNLYISDYSNGVIRKVDTSGVITTFAGSTTATSPGDGGAATSAQITRPQGLAFDTAGNLYIASQYRVRMVGANAGTISTFAGNGTFGYTGDGGPATSATVEFPSAIALDGAGNLYFTDNGADVVRKVTKAGIISTVAGKGPSVYATSIGDGGPATSAVLSNPYGIAVNVSGNLFISDTSNNEVREVTVADGIIHRVIGFAGGACVTMSGDGGLAGISGICSPYGITIDAAGNFYIAEPGISRVRKVTASALPPTAKTAAPVFSVQPGAYATAQLVNITSSTPGAAIYVTLDGSDPLTIGAQFLGPLDVSGPITLKAVAVAPGYLTSDATTASYTIRALPPAVITTVAGTDSGTATPGAPATSVNFGWLTGVAVDADGNIYIPDENHGVIWRVSASTGLANIVAGTLGLWGEQGDNGPATSAQLFGPTHVALAPNGDFYITESFGRRIRKVSGGTITTYAGGANYGGLGDGGPATSAVLANPQGIAVDGSGTLYIADPGYERVRKVTADGIINTAAGTNTSGSSLGDGGPATSATLSYPLDVAVDGAGNLYIADLYAGRVRKVTAATGVISTYAGNGISGSSGDGLLATRAEISPEAVTVDSKGNVFFANFPYTVRVVDAASHVVKTVAGSGYGGFSGDGGSATLATTLIPVSVATDKAGSLYFADQDNSRIRKVTFSSGSPVPQAATPTFSPAPGTYTDAQTVSIADATPGANIYYTTDGSTPTTGSTLYTAPITLSTSATIQAIATATEFLPSQVASGGYVISIPNNPVPGLASLSPAVKTAGGATFTLTVTGSGFVNSSTIYWGSTALTTQYVDASTLTAQVTSGGVAIAGTTSVTVQSPSPGGGTSNKLTFEVDTAGSTPPSFGTTTATVTAGSAATYSVSLPSSATNISGSCLNLPAGASCTYSASAASVTITTSSSTPKGTYQITVVFTETLPGAAAWVLPTLLLPLARVKRRRRLGGILLVLIAGLAVAAACTGCGGGGGGGATTPPPSTHQVTSSATVTLTVQ